MRFPFLMIGLLTSISVPAFAGDLNLALKTGESLCLKREYTATHLANHPDQKLSALYVKFTRESTRFEGETYTYTVAKVIGVSQRKYYGNTVASCEIQADGRLHCFVDCDGGAFYVTPDHDQATLEIQKDYYFPLFKSGKPLYGDDPKPGDQIDLKDDRENGTYLVYPAPNADCDAAYRKYSRGKVEGC